MRSRWRVQCKEVQCVREVAYAEKIYSAREKSIVAAERVQRCAVRKVQMQARGMQRFFCDVVDVAALPPRRYRRSSYAAMRARLPA